MIIEAKELAKAQGFIEIDESLKAFIKDISSKFWTAQVATDFVEQVETVSVRNLDSSWIPVDELKKLGFKTFEDGLIVMTTDVDKHTDDNGMALAWVLKNDAFKFWAEGAGSHSHKVGEWFIFDDYRKHSASPTKKSKEDAVYIIWNVQIERISI